MKTNWRQTLTLFTSETGCPITHGRFFHLFNKTWVSTNADTKKIKNGFQCTGIHPFNQGAIPSEAFLPSTIYTAEVKDQETMETEGIGIEIGTTLHSSFDHSLLNSNKIIKF